MRRKANPRGGEKMISGGLPCCAETRGKPKRTDSFWRQRNGARGNPIWDQTQGNNNRHLAKPTTKG